MPSSDGRPVVHLSLASGDAGDRLSCKMQTKAYKYVTAANAYDLATLSQHSMLLVSKLVIPASPDVTPHPEVTLFNPARLLVRGRQLWRTEYEVRIFGIKPRTRVSLRSKLQTQKNVGVYTKSLILPIYSSNHTCLLHPSYNAREEPHARWAGFVLLKSHLPLLCLEGSTSS